MRSGSRLVAALTLCLIASVSSTPETFAHDFSVTDVLVVFRSDGTYGIDMTVDLDALALGVPPSTDSGLVVAELEAMSAGEFGVCLERARDTVLRRTRVRFDGEKQVPLVEFPGFDAPLLDSDDPPTVLGITARLTGRVPDGSREFSFGASRAFGPVQLTVLEQSGVQTEPQLLEPGGDSTPYLLTVYRQEQPWSRQRVLMLVSIGLAVVGMLWIVRRTFRAS